MNPIVLKPLFPGRWRVLGAGGGGFITRDPIEFRLARGERREIEVRLGPRPKPTVRTVRWRVRILDTDGEPMSREEIRRWKGRGGQEDVRVRWSKDGGFRDRATFDPEGTFEVRAPEDVAPWIEFDRVPMGRPLLVQLERGGGDAEIRLPIRLAEAVHRVRVRVLDPEGSPVEGARVTLDEPRADRSLRGRTDAEGRCAFDGAVPPPWRIYAFKEGFGPTNVKLDRFPAGEVELRLAPPPPAEPKGRLEVHILLERGDFAEAEVVAGPGHHRVRIDALGVGAVDLPPGEYRVTGWIPLADGVVFDVGTAVLRDGATATVSLCGGPLTSARIQVEGAPAGLLEVAVHDAEGRAIVYGAYVRGDRPFRVRYPPSGANLFLCHRDRTLWIDAPRGDVTAKWSDARTR